jgi:predicted nuclease of predicted toxin-antitoxin system
MPPRSFLGSPRLLFLVDENLPDSFAALIRSEGHQAVSARVAVKRGADDILLWDWAARRSALLITLDLDFPLPGRRPAPFAVVLLRPGAETVPAIHQLWRQLSAPAQEDLVPVEVQVAPLQVSEGLLDRGVLVLDAHPGEGIPVGARRDQQEARILEADVALVEKMVDGGRQEQAVLAVQALLVVAVAPGLDVAADQVVGIGDSGDAALILDGPDVLLEDSLADAGGDEGLLFGFRELGAAGDLTLTRIEPESSRSQIYDLKLAEPDKSRTGRWRIGAPNSRTVRARIASASAQAR